MWRSWGPRPAVLQGPQILWQVCSSQTVLRGLLGPPPPREGRLGQVCEGPPLLSTGCKDRRPARQVKEQEGMLLWQTDTCRGATLRRACGPRRGHAPHRGRQQPSVGRDEISAWHFHEGNVLCSFLEAEVHRSRDVAKLRISGPGLGLEAYPTLSTSPSLDLCG